MRILTRINYLVMGGCIAGLAHAISISSSNKGNLVFSLIFFGVALFNILDDERKYK